jgi:excisionase family DNA binding protein
MRTPAPPRDRFISLPDAAAMLGVHTDTLRRFISEGRIPGYRLAGKSHIRLKVSDVEALLTPVVPTEVATSNEGGDIR